jgi:hypothetical protein
MGVFVIIAIGAAGRLARSGLAAVDLGQLGHALRERTCFGLPFAGGGLCVSRVRLLGRSWNG